MKHRTIDPTNWLPAKGYANGMLTKDGVLHIGGQIGWNANQDFVSDEFIDQMRQALRTSAPSWRRRAARSRISPG